MTKKKPSILTERLRASPNFSLTFSFDGRPYVAQDSEPYAQYWLTEEYRLLLAMFSRRQGATVAQALAAYERLAGKPLDDKARARALHAIADMRSADVLIGASQDTSRYDKAIAGHYLTYRPFPPEIADLIVREGGITRDSDVLDLAGGPGDLAVQLAATSDHVTLMELSRGFIDAATQRASDLGRQLHTVNDSCNRIVHSSDDYDVVTVAQALHWLDDAAICRGVSRILRPNGSFFVVHAIFQVPEAHPLAHLFGDNSVLGARRPRPFAEEVSALERRLSLLFEAFDAPDVDRVDPTQRRDRPGRIHLRRSSLLLQQRPMGLGFARAFLTPRHIAVTGMAPDAFWADVAHRCASASPQALQGSFNWAVLQFSRAAGDGLPPETERRSSQTLAYAGPPEHDLR